MVAFHQSGIVLVYDLLNIRHGTVADFNGVAVEDLSERVVCCEYIVNYNTNCRHIAKYLLKNYAIT